MHPWIQIGNVAIPSFFVITSLVAAFSLWFSLLRARDFEISQTFVSDLTLVLMAGALVGARSLHVLYENFIFYREHPERIFWLWEGGFVYYGGLGGALIFGLIFLKIKNEQRWASLFDLYAPVASAVSGLGRWGCFLNGCCYGRFCNLPWSVNGRHPAPLYSFLWELMVFVLLMRTESKLKKNPGALFSLWLCLHGIGRFVLEFIRDDFRGPQWIFSFSGWVSLLIFAVGSFFLVFSGRKSAGNLHSPSDKLSR